MPALVMLSPPLAHARKGRRRMTGLFPLCRQSAAVKARFVRARRGGNVSGIQRWKVEELKGDTTGGKNTGFILEPVS